jgi:hypothetical protein
MYFKSRVTIVGIASGYGLDDRRVGVKNFFFSMSFRQVVGPTQPPIRWVPGALPLGAKRPRRETEHLPSYSAEVKKMWIYTSTPPYAFMT